MQRDMWGVGESGTVQSDAVQANAGSLGVRWRAARTSRGQSRAPRLAGRLGVGAMLAAGAVGAAAFAAPARAAVGMVEAAGDVADGTDLHGSLPDALGLEIEDGESRALEDGDALFEPRLRLELGRSPTRAGFALHIDGGAPHGWALLELSNEGGPAVRELVRLDGMGAARVLRLSHEGDAPIDVVASIPRALDAVAPAPGAYPSVTRRLTVPGAGAMIADTRSRLGWGAPRSPFAALGASATGLVITEIMKDPTTVADTAGEWFEVRNLGPTPIDVSGWRIRDAGSNNHLIPAAAGVVIPPRSYFVFGINASPALNGGVNVGYKYSSFTLANGADDIQLLDASGLLVDAVAYDAGIFWPSTPGKALNLNRGLVDTVLNDDGANWCNALSPISATNPDTGTPRVANNNCP